MDPDPGRRDSEAATHHLHLRGGGMGGTLVFGGGGEGALRGFNSVPPSPP